MTDQTGENFCVPEVKTLLFLTFASLSSNCFEKNSGCLRLSRFLVSKTWYLIRIYMGRKNFTHFMFSISLGRFEKRLRTTGLHDICLVENGYCTCCAVQFYVEKKINKHTCLSLAKQARKPKRHCSLLVAAC